MRFGDEILQAIMDGSPSPVALLDRNGRVISLGVRCEVLCGRSAKEAVGLPFSELFSCPKDSVGSLLWSLAERNGPVQIETNASERPILWTFKSVTTHDGTGMIIAIGEDVTNRKETQDESGRSQPVLMSIISSAMDAVITIDSGQRITLFNTGAEIMFGWRSDEIIGETIDRLIPERFREVHRAHIDAFGLTNTTRRSMGSLGTVRGIRRSGEEFPIEASISQVEFNGTKFYTAVLRDITERMMYEELLGEQAEMLNEAHDAIIVRDLEDRILFWNMGAERLYGWSVEEALSAGPEEVLRVTDIEGYWEAKRILLQEGRWSGELRHKTRLGKDLIVQSNRTLVRDGKGNPKSVLVINTDVTEKKRLQEEFLRAQRLESIGALAAGITHDLGNILSPILMSIRLLQSKLIDEEDRRLLEILYRNGERGAELIRQVLSFARGAEGRAQVVQPRYLINEVVKTLADTFPKSVEIESRIDADLDAVKGDSTQVYQVLMNLCVNARDAMPNGGKLLIRAANTEIDKTYSQMRGETKPGPYVLITVADNGSGIPREIMGRIFEPFFTTKDRQKGTGLGLSTVLSIVTEHGGFLNVYSEPGQGTRFDVYFPADHADQRETAVATGPDIPMARGECILLVDDEAAIREVAKAALEAFGFNVLTAGDGTEALAIYVRHRDKIEVVITDIAMPYMDGTATIRALKKLDQHVKIIATSGMSSDSPDAQAGSLANAFLVKPYTAEKLVRTIAEVRSEKPMARSESGEP